MVERVGLALLAEAAVGLLVLGAVALFLLGRERAGDRLTALHIVLVILVLDCSLFPGGASNGIFVLPINNRTTGPLILIMPMILGLRWLSGQARLRFTLAGMAWTAFFAWLLAEMVAGHFHGNPTAAMIQEIKVVVLLGGAALLVAGVPSRDLVGPRGIPRVVRWATPIVIVLTATSLAHVSSHSSFGLFHGVDTGQLGADAASLFASLGLLGLAVALASPVGHRKGLVSSGVLLVAPVFAGQRASLLGLIAGLVVLALWPVVSRRHRVMRFLPQEKVAIAMAIVFAAGALSLASFTGHGYNPKTSSVATSFGSAGKADSAQARLNQWAIAEVLIPEHPWVGWGLGKTYTHSEPIQDAPAIIVTNDLTHDIFIDITLRGGIVGLAFLLVALITSIMTGLRAALRRISPKVGALGLGATAVLAEMITRGTVESVFEKERLAILLGVAVGVACSASRNPAPSRSTSAAIYARWDVLPAVLRLPWRPLPQRLPRPPAPVRRPIARRVAMPGSLMHRSN